MEEAAELFYNKKDFEPVKLTYQYRRGRPLVASERELRDLPTNICQLHDYYMIDTCNREYTGFNVVITPGYVFNHDEETVHHVYYEDLFRLYQRHSLDTQILMLWTM